MARLASVMSTNPLLWRSRKSLAEGVQVLFRSCLFFCLFPCSSFCSSACPFAPPFARVSTKSCNTRHAPTNHLTQGPWADDHDRLASNPRWNPSFCLSFCLSLGSSFSLFFSSLSSKLC